MIGVIGLLGWVVVFFLGGERRLAVRERMRIDELDLDKVGIEENPRWVQEQVVARLSQDEWRALLPLVVDGWNGGFAWLTPELVRAQMAKSLPDQPNPKHFEATE